MRPNLSGTGTYNTYIIWVGDKLKPSSPRLEINDIFKIISEIHKTKIES